MATEYTNESGKFKKGNPGKPKGVVDTTTKIRMAFLNAFESIGGHDALVEWIGKSHHNKKEFYKMVLSIMPKETHLSGQLDMSEKFIVINFKDIENFEQLQRMQFDSSQN